MDECPSCHITCSYCKIRCCSCGYYYEILRATGDKNAWWVINEHELLRALRHVANGQSPDLVMAELLANSEIQNEAP